MVPTMRDALLSGIAVLALLSTITPIGKQAVHQSLFEMSSATLQYAWQLVDRPEHEIPANAVALDAETGTHIT